eukprot:TRINITY_DN55208_c0_g1_i1.p1 TRINITY_DN55208_c0_g1~~TRINITY_DN55208_c0_g1_i1.p1  ORF type:complete len:328 (-),score=32.83 TRINITY_DN55208_c0_g1_i1:32-1015(-)
MLSLRVTRFYRPQIELCFTPIRAVTRNASATPRDNLAEAVRRALRKDGTGGILHRQEFKTLQRDSGYNDTETMAFLHELLPFAKAAAIPQVSDYQVGAIALGASGSAYLGFNLELAGLPLQHTVHAEQSAIYLAADAGERALLAIASSTTPCGHCRQFMQELYQEEPLHVTCPGQETAPLSDLLPQHFGPEHLELQNRLLNSPVRDLSLDAAETCAATDLCELALMAACKAYVPFDCPAGIALRTRDGIMAAGFGVGSVAFNPGMTTAGPLQGALVKLTAAGCRDWRSIDEAVLIEKKSAAIQYKPYVELALKAISPGAKLHTVHAM